MGYEGRDYRRARGQYHDYRDRDRDSGRYGRPSGYDYEDRGFFDRAGDFTLHHLRRCAAVGCAYRYSLVGDIRVLIDRQATVRHYAQDDEQHHQHCREDGPLDRNIRKKHEFFFAG